MLEEIKISKQLNLKNPLEHAFFSYLKDIGKLILENNEKPFPFIINNFEYELDNVVMNYYDLYNDDYSLLEIPDFDNRMVKIEITLKRKGK